MKSKFTQRWIALSWAWFLATFKSAELDAIGNVNKFLLDFESVKKDQGPYFPLFFFFALHFAQHRWMISLLLHQQTSWENVSNLRDRNPQTQAESRLNQLHYHLEKLASKQFFKLKETSGHPENHTSWVTLTQEEKTLSLIISFLKKLSLQRMFIRFIVVITLQYIQISKFYVVHLKLTISQK